MSAPPPPAKVHRFLDRLVLVQPGEGRILVLATSYFFLLLFSYYLLRPMREAFGIARGADKLPWLMTGTMACMFLANPAFAALVARFPRRRFIPIAYRACIACMGLFYLLFKALPGHGGAPLGYVFYIWLSVFNLFVVSVFWAFLADGLGEDQGKRLFGFIAAGGTLGAILGAATTQALTGGLALAGHLLRLEPPTMLILAMVALELAVGCAGRLVPLFHMGDSPGSASGEPGPGMFAGLGLFFGSPYLGFMGLYILLFTVTSTLLYMQQGAIVFHTFSSQAARTAAFARIDVWVNVLTLFTQVFLASRIITRFGLAVVLCLMPVLSILGFGALWAAPTFATLMAFQVLRRGLHYAVDRPAREVLYIPLSPDAKYKAKPFIDTFIYRTGDLLGTWTPLAVSALAVPVGAAAVAISGLWLGAGLLLGRLRRSLPSVRR